MSIYLTVGEVTTLHSMIIDEFGGVPGVRDLDAVKSAVFRPQVGNFSNIVAEAAALMENIVNLHPFVDGNKRTAIAAADVHLRMNRLQLRSDSAEHYRTIIDMMDGDQMDWHSIEDWLRQGLDVISEPPDPIDEQFEEAVGIY